MSDQPHLLTKAQVTRYRGLKQGRNRKQEGLFLLEGVRLCEEAFRSNLKLETCIIRKNFDKLTIPNELVTYEATNTQLEQISDSKNPQGIVCIARIPDKRSLPSPEPGKILLVLDRLADPGNMGTIFRSALWFGVSHILLGPDCVDPYSPKVVRASMGDLASLKLHSSDDLKISAEAWKEAAGQVAALHMSGSPLDAYRPQQGLFLIVGSEAHGVAQELLDSATSLSIMKIGVGESLNAAMATGIALYELTRTS
ncbi:MAG: RNA methyltransferase [Candidatus Marinimicrobia bacterium]|nr:RNA methyltransferase [Candidatus Neomarinimicrobiota bacterium]